MEWKGVNGGPTVISTFSGCGGSSLGYKQAGFDVRVAVEFDPMVAQVYRANHATRLVEADVTSVTGAELLSYANIQRGELDVFDGSPPCQDFSRSNVKASKRTASVKQNLVFEYARLVNEIQPKTFVMENVAAMTQGKAMGIFRRLLEEFKQMQYAVQSMIVDAQYLGVPQRRRRVILIGSRNDQKQPIPILPQTSPISALKAFEDLPIDERAAIGLGKVQKELWKKCKAGNGFDSVHPRKQMWSHIKLDPHSPSPTLTCAPSFYSWEAPRLLTIPELARLASFPDEFIFPEKYTAAAHVIGNCVPPEMMRRIALPVSRSILCGPDANPE